MSTARVPVVGIVAFLLICGLSLGTMAQDEMPMPELLTDIVYGAVDPARQALHVYTLAPRDPTRPAVVMPHGGGLISGSPDMDRGWAKKTARQGYVTFMVGYRLFDPETGANPWQAQLDDAQQAVR